jgi:DNA-binding MarR family transcriptional regulator
MSESPKRASQQITSLVEQMDRDLAAIRRVLRRPLEIEIARGELTVPQTAVMRVVVRQPGVSLKNLSRQLSLAHSTVSGIVDRLEKQGMLTRKPDPSDGRASCIYPTRPVVEFVSKQIPVLSQGPLQNALDRATPAEREAIAKALSRLRQLLEAG